MTTATKMLTKTKQEQSYDPYGVCPCCQCKCEKCTHTNEGGCCENGCNDPGKKVRFLKVPNPED